MTEWRTLTWLPDYEVSENGEVRRIHRRHSHPAKRLLAGTTTRNGYRRHFVYQDGARRWCFTHRLVCEAWNGPRPSDRHVVAHGDGNRANNHYSNLRWATYAENEADKIAHRTNHAGERHPMAKLTWANVREIRELYAPGRAASLARQFGVSAPTIANIITRKNWKEECA